MKSKKNNIENMLDITSTYIAFLGVVAAIISLVFGNASVGISENKLILLVTLISIVIVVTSYVMLVIKRISPRTCIYCSYCEFDSKIASKFCKRLENALNNNSRFRYVLQNYENAVSYGDYFEEKINQSIDNCEIVIVFVSKEYFESKAYIHELNAIREKRKVIIPILVQHYNEIELYPEEMKEIKSVFLYRYFNESEFENIVEQLSRDIIKRKYNR